MRKKLIEWEKKHGYMSKYVAEKINVSEATWCMIKSGKQNPTYKQIMKLRDEFGIGLELLDDEKEKP